MTCVLPVTPFYTNAFNRDANVEFQNKAWDKYDFGVLNAQHVKSGLLSDHKCSTQCQADISSGSPCQDEDTKDLSATIKNKHCDVPNEKCQNTYRIKGTDKEINVPSKGKNQFEICKKAQTADSHISTKQGLKRKTDITETEELYIQPKRVSPFLNTPKQRKDERKNILKISVNKLKLLDDPETFLRRTVLVNNTMKKLQRELQAEILRTKSRERLRRYEILNNNCMLDSYLIDDPFLSGVHEKITDDMTDTLINNVLHLNDSPNDMVKYYDNEEVLSAKHSENQTNYAVT